MATRTVSVAAPAALAAAAMLAAAWGLVPGHLGWNVAWTAAAATALAGMLEARRGARPDGRERWTWWAGAAALWLAGQLFWDLFSIVGFPRSPNLADIGWEGFAALVIVGLLRTAGRSRGDRAVATLEVLALTAAAMA